MNKFVITFVCVLNIIVGVSAQQTNVLIITADDLNWNTVASFNGEQQGQNVTPNIDALAAQGIRFTNAHVASTACMPSRNAINTGRLPHRSGGEGFHDLRIKNIPTIPSVFDANGYFVGILGKIPHSTPYVGVTPWHIAEEMERNTDTFYERMTTVIDSALNTVGKPFYLIVNSHDPHRPYYNLNSVGTTLDDKKSHPSKVFYPDDVTLPAWLPEDETIREEMAEYLCSSRRMDDVVGKALQVLDEQGIANNTLVFFLSDHGMAAPSIKSNIYHHSTKTPLIMRWPANNSFQVGSEIGSMVSALDIFPSICEATGIEIPSGIDGQSLLPLIDGVHQEGRDVLFTTYNTTISKNIYAFRKVHSSKYAYVFNPWHDGRTTYNSSSLGASFFETMLNIGQNDEAWQQRCDFILSRVPEEFYDVETDPDCLYNLMDEDEYQQEIAIFKEHLRQEMTQSNDPILAVFDVFQQTRDVQQMYSKFVSVIAEEQWLGHAPNLVVVEDHWTIFPPEGTIYEEDFEHSPYTYSKLGGAPVTIVSNPLKQGINTSDKVLKIEREMGNVKTYIGASTIVSTFDAPRYVHMKILKSRASNTRFQLSKDDNSGKLIKNSMESYDVNQLGEWQDLVFDMGDEYKACSKVWFQVDHTSEDGPHNVYVDDILLNNDPHSRTPISTEIIEEGIADIKLFPNPAFNRLYLSGSNICGSKIIDLSGNVCKVYNSEDLKNGMEISDLKQGVYLVRIQFHGYVFVRKFFKK